MYAFRLYPTRVQKKRLLENFVLCRQVYNELLTLSQQHYQQEKKTVHKYAYNKHLKGYSSAVHSQVLQNVSDRVQKAFQHFFRRVREKQQGKNVRVGFPRFKKNVQSITYPQHGFKFLNEQRLYCAKIGEIPIVLHRVPRGRVKTLTIKRTPAGQWSAIFACELPEKIVPHPSAAAVGIDVGLTHFATCSDGTVIDNPKYFLAAQKKIKKLHRTLSRKKKGSKNRCKARQRLARAYDQVSHQRHDFLHKLSTKLTNTYATIALESLSVHHMAKNRYLAKSIHDASWFHFVQMLSYKAVTRGGQLIKVNPRHTSTLCSSYGNHEPMPLHQRTFSCSACNLVLDRDHNAALNIYGRAGRARTLTPVEIV